jgi:hypothetical protein
LMLAHQEKGLLGLNAKDEFGGAEITVANP